MTVATEVVVAGYEPVEFAYDDAESDPVLPTETPLAMSSRAEQSLFSAWWEQKEYTVDKAADESSVEPVEEALAPEVPTGSYQPDVIEDRAIEPAEVPAPGVGWAAVVSDSAPAVEENVAETVASNPSPIAQVKKAPLASVVTEKIAAPVAQNPVGDEPGNLPSAAKSTEVVRVPEMPVVGAKSAEMMSDPEVPLAEAKLAETTSGFEMTAAEAKSSEMIGGLETISPPVSQPVIEPTKTPQPADHDLVDTVVFATAETVANEVPPVVKLPQVQESTIPQLELAPPVLATQPEIEKPKLTAKQPPIAPPVKTAAAPAFRRPPTDILQPTAAPARPQPVIEIETTAENTEPAQAIISIAPVAQADIVDLPQNLQPQTPPEMPDSPKSPELSKLPQSSPATPQLDSQPPVATPSELPPAQQLPPQLLDTAPKTETLSRPETVAPPTPAESLVLDWYQTAAVASPVGPPAAPITTTDNFTSEAAEHLAPDLMDDSEDQPLTPEHKQTPTNFTVTTVIDSIYLGAVALWLAMRPRAQQLAPDRV